MSVKTIVEIILGLMGLVTAFFVAQAKIKESKAKKKDPTWQPNPKRCQEERDRIAGLEGQNKVWVVRFDNVDQGLKDLKSGQDRILDLHLKS
jgi:hypothetical protein